MMGLPQQTFRIWCSIVRVQPIGREGGSKTIHECAKNILPIDVVSALRIGPRVSQIGHTYPSD